jgi:carboxylesterase type B
MKARLEKAYRPHLKSMYKTEFDAVAAIGTDMSFTCITSREASISATSGYPTWRYLFNASYTNTERFPGSGAIHASEIQFVFGNLADTSTPEELALSKLMQKTWGDFAKRPDIGPGWAQVHTAGALDLGHFHSDGRWRQESATFVDRNCRIFEKLYEGRA